MEITSPLLVAGPPSSAYRKREINKGNERDLNRPKVGGWWLGCAEGFRSGSGVPQCSRSCALAFAYQASKPAPPPPPPSPPFPPPVLSPTAPLFQRAPFPPPVAPIPQPNSESSGYRVNKALCHSATVSGTSFLVLRLGQTALIISSVVQTTLTTSIVAAVAPVTVAATSPAISLPSLLPLTFVLVSQSVMTTSTYVVAWPQGDQLLGGGPWHKAISPTAQ